MAKSRSGQDTNTEVRQVDEEWYCVLSATVSGVVCEGRGVLTYVRAVDT